MEVVAAFEAVPDAPLGEHAVAARLLHYELATFVLPPEGDVADRGGVPAVLVPRTGHVFVQREH